MQHYLDDPFGAAEQIRAPWMKPHEFVLIKTEMSTEDTIAIQNKLARVDAKSGKEIVMQLGDVMLLTLQRLVKGWNLTQTVTKPDGTTMEVALPFAVDLIRKLPKRHTDFIYAEINKRNQEPDQEEQRDFLIDAGAPSEESR